MKKVLDMQEIKIKVDFITEADYEDETSWVHYSVGGKMGYEICEDFEEGMEAMVEKIYNRNDSLKEILVNKKDISVCSNYLATLIENCRQSDNDMWYVDGLKELCHDTGLDSLQEAEKFLAKLQKEIDDLGLEKYIEINKYGFAITVYGGVIMQFLF